MTDPTAVPDTTSVVQAVERDACTSGAALLVDGPEFDRDVVEASGPDARSFLQSLVSQDLAAIEPGAGAQSLLLQPQGKLIAPFRILSLADDEWRLDGDPGTGVPLLEGLSRFKIRVKVDLVARDDVATLSLRGPLVDEVSARCGLPVVPVAAHSHVAGEFGVRVVRAPWGATDGLDMFVPSADVDSWRARLIDAGAIAVDAAVVETARVEHGVLRFGADIDGATIAQEAELELDAVSFTKGCFVGQELVCRIDSRGHVNRFVRRLEFLDGAVAPAVGSEVHAAAGDSDKVLGAITSAAPLSAFAFATVRREIEPGATVLVEGREARVHARIPTS